MFACIYLNIIEHLSYLKYRGRQDWKCSNELERILCLFVNYNQHLPVLRKVELTLEKALQHLNLGMKWHLVLLCIFLIINEIEHFFISFLSILVSSFLN